jgi:cell division protein FtsI (penicillin-binding protein 3)
LKTKRMVKNKYIASFAGFWPADRPEIVGVIVLDEPEPIHYGGWTAAPILLNVFRRGSCAKDRFPDQQPIMMASATDAAPAAGMVAADAAGTGKQVGAEEQVSFWSLRRARVPCADGLPTDRVPNVLGLTAREAIALLNSCGLRAGLTGAGRVVRQNPGAGAHCGQGELCQLSLK